MQMKLLLNPTILLVFALMAIIVMMVVPIPAIILDFGLAASFAIAILIFTVTLFVERPLDFSSFPTILLASLMLRLALNIASTKLIIGEGHSGTNAAGDVIESFASFIMNGSVFLGLVVFSVLLIVNFMVITKGATRMAEVGARFALDGMPGKQLAIDSDVAAGALTHEEAKARRELEQQETTFFGSLDGASKFVKGDAVAGLLITLLNLVAGLVIGTLVHGLSIGSAFETYAILTVGDGLVSQVPAVIISIASALLLAKGRSQGAVDAAIFSQLGRHAPALFSVAALLALFALLPGLPFFPFVAGSLVLILFGIVRSRSSAQGARDIVPEEIPEPTQKPIGDLLELDDIHIEFSSNLVNLVLDPEVGLDARIANMRRHVASTFGVILPEVRLSDNSSFQPGTYVVKIYGVEHAKGKLEVEKVLALLPDGFDLSNERDLTTEPVYNAPAKWITRNEADGAAMDGMTLVTPVEILATHILETIKRNLARLLTLKSLRRLLTEVTSISDPRRAQANQKLLDEIIPDKVPIDVLHAVLRLLLEEQVSIRNLPLILESISEARLTTTSTEAICEYVRQRLGFQISSELRRDDGTLPLVQLAPEWEEVFLNYQLVDSAQKTDIALPPDLFNKLADNIAAKVLEANSAGHFPALISSTNRRRFLRTLTRAKGMTVPVLSFEEIGIDAKPALLGMVEA